MPDSFSIGLCGKRLTWSAEFGILEKIMGFFLKGKSKDLEKGKRMSEKEQEMTSKKLGLHVGDSFQDTREIREVLDKSVFREEEPTHSQQAEVLEEPVAMEASEEIRDAKPEAVAEPTQESEQEAEQTLSRMSRRSRKAGVEAAKAEASKVEENTEELEADVAV